ncbi:MAG: methyltransferase domain-containing protein [Proteobacteria bacterium]|nr:methyltransferase domain-containing protein [Pseudomonadota bacterium]
MNIEVTDIVKDRYAKGAGACESNLCCAVDYDPALLEVIPDEVIERDYGCGDPSRFVREGETVLDLGSGTGKICFIASQIVGPEGQVIGIDMTDEMLTIARDNAPVVGTRIGYENVEFRRGKIQDLATDLDLVNDYLQANPVGNLDGYEGLQAFVAKQKVEHPLVADDSVDLIVSNCVLNLVSDSEKHQLFSEMYRVLKRGGRIAISDIVSDEPSTPELKADPALWSGCVSGALVESEFTQLLEDASTVSPLKPMRRKPGRLSKASNIAP